MDLTYCTEKQINGEACHFGSEAHRKECLSKQKNIVAKVMAAARIRTYNEPSQLGIPQRMKDKERAHLPSRWRPSWDANWLSPFLRGSLTEGGQLYNLANEQLSKRHVDFFFLAHC